MTETVTERRIVNVATLDSSVRMVIFQFMLPNDLIPAVIQSKRAPAAPPVTPVRGVMVMPSTPELNILPIAKSIGISSDYELVDVWHKPSTSTKSEFNKNRFKMSVLQFTYCRKEYVRHEELYPDFVEKRDQLATELVTLVSNNLWAVQAYLNPYLETDGWRTGQDVLMFGCAGRKSDVEVWSGGRDENNRGIGNKVPLSTIASKLRLVEDEFVQLELR